MARVWVEAYGCSASQADSEAISGIIEAGGHTLAASHDEADAGVIVTCSVKDATASRMVHRMKSLSSKPLVVAGCLPKAEMRTVERFAGPRAGIIGPRTIERAAEAVDAALSGGRLVALGDTDGPRAGLPRVRLNPVVAIVEIAAGCMSECSFCQTKLAKGGLRSHRVGDIVRQVREDVGDGCREVWLTSTDNGCYGLDIGADLPELVGAVAGVPGRFRVRVGMMNPMYMPRMRGGLLDAYASEKVYKFAHLPVQSGSGTVLAAMRRAHTAGTFAGACAALRERFGRFTVATDVIVGFPGETDEDFGATMDLLRDTRPEIVNVSKYSARPGTEAAGMEQVDADTVRRRSRAASEMAAAISREANAGLVGSQCEVLLVERTGDGGLKGRDDRYRPVHFGAGTGAEPGQMLRARVTGCTDHGLSGELC